PDAILITQEMAKKYFGAGDAIGKVLKKDNSSNVVVTGVLANIPSNSHLQFDFIMPLSAIAQTNNDIKNSVWDNFNFYAYIQLDKKPDAAAVSKFNKQMDEIYQSHIAKEKLNALFQLQ